MWDVAFVVPLLCSLYTAVLTVQHLPEVQMCYLMFHTALVVTAFAHDNLWQICAKMVSIKQQSFLCDILCKSCLFLGKR